MSANSMNRRTYLKASSLLIGGGCLGLKSSQAAAGMMGGGGMGGGGTGGGGTGSIDPPPGISDKMMGKWHIMGEGGMGGR